MKTKVILFTLFLCMMAMSMGANAQVNYDEGHQILPSNYIAPKMDCRRTGAGAGQYCAMLAYDNTSKKLELFITSSRFLNDSLPLTADQTVLTDANYGHIIGMNPATAIPYDINWNESQEFLIYDGTTTAKQIDDDGGSITTVSNAAPYHPLMAGDKTNAYFWSKLLSTTGVWHSDIYNTRLSGAVNWGSAKSANNWLGTGGGDYVAGLHLEAENGDMNKSYILYAYNSTDGRKGYSNNTDALIGASLYDGIFEREWKATSYEIFLRNSTDVLRYDLSSNQTTSFFAFNGNNIISQSLWINYLNVNDAVVVFQNSSGINIYNTFSSLYSAVPEEYNESIAIEALTPDYFLGLFRANNPYYPKVACSPDFGSCALLVYDTGVFSVGGAGLKLYYTLTPDQPNWGYEYTFPEGYGFTGDLADYPPAYDIRYNTADGKFRIISDTKLYEWDGSALPVNIMSYSTFATYGQNRGIAFVDEEGDEVLAVIHHGTVPYYRASISVTAWNSQSLGTNIWTCSPSLYIDGCVSSSMRASVTRQGTNNKYELRTNQWEYDVFPVTKWYNQGTQYEDNLQMIDDFTYTQAYQYYYPEEGVVFFERDAGDTPNDYGNGMYYAGHNPPTGADWIYPTVTPYYAYDDLYAEDTDASSRYFEEQKIYSVSKRATSYGCIPFVGCGKVLFHRKSNNPLFVTTSYYDDAIGTTNPLTTSMTAECLDPAINYTASAGASFYAFQLPCNTNINLTLQTTSAYPFFHEENFDFPVGCDYLNVEAVYIKSFTSTLTVRDQITGQGIPSATVYVDGSPYTTDADGQIDFIIAPTSATFDVTTNPSACLITMDATAAAVSESHYVYITKTGYYPFSGTIAFDADGYTAYLNQGEFIVSRVYYKDGIEATGEKTSAMINATGADQIYVIRSGIPYNESEDNNFPVTFQTIDASSSYSVTLGLRWGNYTDTTVVSVTPAKNNYGCGEDACFELPFYSTDAEVGCATDLDCEQSFCLGTIFKELLSCNIGTGQCTYQQTACPTFCDDDIGCYTQVQANESCNFDSECYDLIGCISTAVLRDASCSPSLGVCVTEHVQCTYGCEDGACNPAPTVPTCDQSTVAGMLACTQSGIMGFIGVTYDPMFMILVVVAIVIVAVTLISLAVKGVSNVIR